MELLLKDFLKKVNKESYITDNSELSFFHSFLQKSKIRKKKSSMIINKKKKDFEDDQKSIVEKYYKEKLNKSNRKIRNKSIKEKGGKYKKDKSMDLNLSSKNKKFLKSNP